MSNNAKEKPPQQWPFPTFKGQPYKPAKIPKQKPLKPVYDDAPF